ncbi:unnamed protein product [Paramecium octaurelia]|uniref:Uncharacterized protein n=1 Tax=Paramecium octaurelia TaxID=43137 RepID=A0A8S1V9K2_PAROT|nr:unnamed protein product [Paramecium octaurelia]
MCQKCNRLQQKYRITRIGIIFWKLVTPKLLLIVNIQTSKVWQMGCDQQEWWLQKIIIQVQVVNYYFSNLIQCEWGEEYQISGMWIELEDKFCQQFEIRLKFKLK